MSGVACAARTEKGYPCLNQASGDAPFCSLHSGRNTCRGYAAGGRPCKARAVSRDGYCPSHA